MRNTRRAIAAIAVGAVALTAGPAAAADGTLRVTIDGRPAALAGTTTSIARVGDSTVSGRTVTLGLRAGSGTSVVHGAVGEGLRITAGGRSVRLTNLRLDGVGSRNVRVSARIDGKARRTLFAVSTATTRTDTASGARTIAASPLRVTAAGTRSLRYRLGRTVDAQRIGRIALAEAGVPKAPDGPSPVPAPSVVIPPPAPPATTTPVDPPAPEPKPEPLPVVRAIEDAQVDWPFSQWIVNVFSCSYPGVVCPLATDGATVTATGEGTGLLRTFHFPRRADGSYDTETGKATVALGGTIRVGYVAPGHGIATWIADPTVEIDGDSAVLSGRSAAGAPPATVWYPPSGNSSVDPLDGPGANAWVPPLTERPIATLDLSTDGEDAAVKTVSEDGKTITWSNVPATATAEAAAIGHGVIVEGYALDRLTLTVKVADRAPVVD